MKKITALFMTLVLLISMNFVYINASNPLIYQTTTREIITKGLTYEHKAKFTEDGWVDIYVMIMDLEEEQVALDVIRSMDTFGLRGTLSNLANESEEQLVGGVNGSFFNMSTPESDPVGIFYEEGFGYVDQHYNTGGNGAASIVQKYSGETFFDFFGISVTFQNENGRRLYLSGINKLTGTDGPIIYNELFGKDSTQLDSMGDYYKIVIEKGIVINVVEPGVLATMPPLSDGYIVSLPKAIAEVHLPSFSVGMGVDLQIDSTLNYEEIKFAISGGGKIVENGAVVEEGILVDKNARHPRTAIGITKDQRYLIAMVVDGRGSSIGATHNELAQYLIEYNVSDGIHMDGGGSSTMIGRELGYSDIEVLNVPSDGAQRKVLNGIGFVSLSPIGEPVSIKVVASAPNVFKNNPIYLEVIGYDANYNPVVIDTKNVSWSVQGVDGTWKTNIFTPSSVGSAKLTCYYQGLSTTIALKSLDSPIDLTVSPRLINIDYGKTASFTITGVDYSGYEGAINLNDVTYTLDNPAIGSFSQGIFTASNTSGISKVTIRSGARVTSAYITVGSEKAVVEAFESASFVGRSFPEDSVTGALTIDKGTYYDTDKSYRFDYSFKSTPDSQAYYMMLDGYQIETKTDKISIWLNGNESGHMFKGKVIDANGLSQVITFTDNISWKGWKEVSANINSDLAYPLTLDRLYVVTLQSVMDYSGTIYVDAMSVMKNIDTSNLRFDSEGFINDPLMVNKKPSGSTEIKFFGATSDQNRLLDAVIMNKVYEKMSTANYAVFCGLTEIDPSMIKAPYATWNNAYATTSADGVKIIRLATGSGGLRKTDYEQYTKLQDTLSKTTENTIVLVGSKNPIKNFSDSKEGELLHKILKEFKEKTGKTIIYVSASGYETDATIKDDIRYIDLSGLWYTITDRYVDLNKTFYSLNIYITKGVFSYMIEPLYPLIEIN